MIRHLVIGLLSLVCVVALSMDSEAFARRCCKPARDCCAKKTCCAKKCCSTGCTSGACAATTTPAPAVAGTPTPAPAAEKTAAAADKASDGATTESTTVATRTRRFGNGTLRAAASSLMVRR